MKPNFIVIGAARSGTTSLFKYLEAHPDIFMSEIKEINFFSNEKMWSKGFEWYLRHFKGANHRLVGEASTSYTSAPAIADVPQRIREHLGKIKLIYMVRDPLDRLLSHYVHRVSRGVETRSLHEIVAGDLEGSSESLLWQGRYTYQIDRFLEHFEVDDLHVLSLENLGADPSETVSKIFEFLGVDLVIGGTSYEKRHNSNASATRKGPFGRAVLDLYHEHVEQRPLPYTLKRQLLRLAEIDATPIDKPALGSDEIDRLMGFYCADVAALEQRFAVDVSRWRNYRVAPSVHAGTG